MSKQTTVDPIVYGAVLRSVALQSGLEPEDLKGVSRQRPVVRARWVLWLALHLKRFTNSAIARRGGFDQTTVGYGIAEAKRLARRNPEFARLVRWARAA